MTTEISFLPKEVDQIDIAFGRIKGLIPPLPGNKDINKAMNSRTWGYKLFADWFYAGVKNLKLIPKPGIDEQKALRHISAIMRSFEPPHETKTWACGYLFELWFESATWEIAKDQ